MSENLVHKCLKIINLYVFIKILLSINLIMHLLYSYLFLACFLMYSLVMSLDTSFTILFKYLPNTYFEAEIWALYIYVWLFILYFHNKLLKFVTFVVSFAFRAVCFSKPRVDLNEFQPVNNNKSTFRKYDYQWKRIIKYWKSEVILSIFFKM